jgi:hypothetical protein
MQLSNVVLPVDRYTSFLAHYDITANDVLKGAVPVQNSTTLRASEGKYGGGIAIEDGTTNIIPGGTKNMYPSYGNNHGTYNTNQYNGNVYFSIGTITSVENNVVTYVPTKSLRTYDAVRPQTTGGGLTAGTVYFIKALSTTQFTVHAYNSSQDGSQGFAVHDSIKNDVRIAINATDFPTMWHGPAHLPNSGLVKEIIPNGFSFNGISHDCLRLYTNFRTDSIYDYMAYGVGAPITANIKYTYSFYYRAVTPESIGRVVSFSLHNGVGFNGGSFTLGVHWQRHTITTSSTVTGGASMYWNAGFGLVWEIAEIQCEQKEYATSFTTSTRSDGKLWYDKSVINTSKFTLSCWFNVPSMHIVATGNEGIQGNWYHPIIEICPSTLNGATGYSLCAGPNASGFNRKLIQLEPSNTGNIGIAILDNVWYNMSVVVDGSTITTYIDGIKQFETTSSPIVPVSDSVLMVGGGYRGKPRIIVDELRIDNNIARTEEEVVSWYLSGNPFSPKGIYRLAY